MVATRSHTDVLETKLSRGASLPARDAGAVAVLPERFGSLDGIRALAILAVLWHHTPGVYGLFPGSNRGFLGVDMFFVLSGFLITTLLIRERRRLGGISLRAFWARRSLRIFPVYYVFLAAITSVAVVLGLSGATELLEALPAHLLYLSNFATQRGPALDHLWSLATEEQFYLVWPFVEAYAGPTLRMLLLAAAIGANVVWATRLGLEPNLEMYDLEIGQATYLPILLGVALAHGLDSAGVRRVLFPLFHPRFASLAWLGILLFGTFLYPSDLQGIPRIAIQVLMAGFLGACVMQPKHVLSGLLDARPLVLIGTVSYGMYLFHMAVFGGLQKVESRWLGEGGLGPLGFVVIGSLLTYVVAAMSFRWFETPLLRLKTRFARV